MDQLLDPRKPIPGWKGELFTDDGQKLVQVNEWELRLNFKNSTMQPGGQINEISILQSVEPTLVFTETVISDAPLLQKVMLDVKSGKQPVLGFQGKIKGNDSTTGRYVCRSCVPDGDIDIAKIKTGDIVTRQWTFKVNELPDLVELLGVAG